MGTALNKQCRFVDTGPWGSKKDKERKNIRVGPDVCPDSRTQCIFYVANFRHFAKNILKK